MSEIPKKDREQYDLHIRIPADMGDKLKMLKKETGRSFADIVSILIDGAKVGELASQTLGEASSSVDRRTAPMLSVTIYPTSTLK
jgi:predicted DNA-binding protein